MSKNTARFSANAHVAFKVNIFQSKTNVASAIIAGYSTNINGNAKKNAHAGET